MGAVVNLGMVTMGMEDQRCGLRVSLVMEEDLDMATRMGAAGEGSSGVGTLLSISRSS